jgi:hypothetical protein
MNMHTIRVRTVARVLTFFLVVFVPGAGLVRADVDAAEAANLERTVDSMVGQLVPNVFRNARATYLEGYGVIVTIEVALDVPRTPFTSSRSPADVRESALGRIASIRQGAIGLVGNEAPGIEGLLPEEMVSVVVYMVNPNPVDLADLPGQIVVSARKQDAIDLESGRVTAAVFADRVRVRED